MVDLRKDDAIAVVVDLVLLVAVFKAGFMLNPGERPELAMLVTAAIVQLIFGPRGNRFFGPAVAGAAVILLLFAFFYGRAADAWPLAVWLLMLPGWRLMTSRTASLPPVLTRVGDRVKSKARVWLPWIGRRVWAVVRELVRGSQRLVAWPGMRYLRVTGLVLAGIGLMWPYLTRGIVGAGDAKWYANTVADYVVQLRAGVFPIWTGQSDYSFYGGIFPLRLAPYLAHLAGVLDLVTARQMPPYAVMNAALVVSVIAGMVTMYVCLRQVAPGRPWSMLGLSLCYGLCPGVLGLAYAQDLYMSVCTLPFVPVAFLGVVRSFQRDDLGARLLMSGALAATWLAHPPIGLWCGLVVTASQIIRWYVRRAEWRSTWRYDALGVMFWLLLAGYSLVSARSLGPLQGVDSPAANHYLFIREAFPANWLPLHREVRAANNLQLGYGLAALGLMVAWWGRGNAPSAARVLLAAAAGLVVLLLPIPFLTEYLWRALPQVVLNITNVWPMQRLLVPAAVCVVMGAAVWLDATPSDQAAHRHFCYLLLAALAWGGAEAAKFIVRGHAMAGGWSQTELMFRPENRVMTHSALGPRPVQPRYFNHGVTDLQLEHRFLSVDKKEIIRNATDAIMPGVGPGAGSPGRPLLRQFTGQRDAELPMFTLAPQLTLEPGKHYLLVLDFADRDYSGTLKLEGRDFSRVYGLPESGNQRAFGTKPENARWIALWQTTAQPQEVILRWLPARPGEWSEPHVPFANFELVEYDPAKLDIVLESLMPYRASVNAPETSYIETPRVFLPGYAATVDGRPVPVEMSPDGFVMVRLKPGRQVLELSYEAPQAARVAYGLGLAAWVGFMLVTMHYFRGDGAQRRAS